MRNKREREFPSREDHPWATFLGPPNQKDTLYYKHHQQKTSSVARPDFSVLYIFKKKRENTGVQHRFDMQHATQLLVAQSKWTFRILDAIRWGKKKKRRRRGRQPTAFRPTILREEYKKLHSIYKAERHHFSSLSNWFFFLYILFFLGINFKEYYY